MANRSKSICVLALAFILSPLAATSHAMEAPTPRSLIERAIELRKNDQSMPKYTYFMLSHSQNRTRKGKLFLDLTTLYEYTWIGDLPYGRIREQQGKPLSGKALADEEARYDKALAEHAGLDVDARAKARHFYLLDTSLHLDPLLRPGYTLSELRQEDIAGTSTHVIDCTPTHAIEAPGAAPTRHVTLWITGTGVTLRETYELLADEPDKLHGSHGQEDFQLSEGTWLPQHHFFHLNAPNGNTGDFEETYTRFRRFSASARIVPDAP